jgi:hypothetical protein
MPLLVPDDATELRGAPLASCTTGDKSAEPYRAQLATRDPSFHEIWPRPFNFCLRYESSLTTAYSAPTRQSYIGALERRVRPIG